MPSASGACLRQARRVPSASAASRRVVISRLRMTGPRDSSLHGARSRLLPLTLTALGVVYGDIGTSPLYALRESFYGSHSVPPSHENVLGLLSFVLYALIFIISIKYIVVVMRADNQG